MTKMTYLTVGQEFISLTGEIIALDFETGSGKILIFKNSYIAEDIYDFVVDKRIQTKKLFQDSFLKAVKINCQLKSELLLQKPHQLKHLGLKIFKIELL